jgi:hypothetical protein
MKIFKLSLIATSFVLIGCGGGGSNNSNSTLSELTPVKTVDDAKTSYKAINSFESIDISEVNSGYNKMSKGMQKSESAACTDGGSISYSSTDTKLIVSYAKCQLGDKYYNGDVRINVLDNDNYTIEISDYTSRDVGGEQYMNITMVVSKSNDIETVKFNGVMNQTSKSNDVSNISLDNMIIVEKDTYSESWSTIDGGINLKSKCVTGNYKFTTVEKLVDAQDGTYNTESGILDINGARYTFENPYVTVKTATEEDTMLQSELEKEMESNSCN